MWAIDADPYVVDVYFFAMQRDNVSQQLAAIPDNEKPSRDELENYRSYDLPEEDLAWSDVYPQVCMWLIHRDKKRKQAAQFEHSNPNDLSQYNYGN